MRRAERLFEIIQLLRRVGRPTTAAAIAEELETSPRTIYRDIAVLIARDIPIRGEAGLGYLMEAGHDLPPLMLSPDEVQAAALGAQWVAAHGDAVLARAAENLIAKIVAVLPDAARASALAPAVGAPPAWQPPDETVDAAYLRVACTTGRKLKLIYTDARDRPSERIVWPFLLAYRDSSRILIAWCEMRGAVRSFRTERIANAVELEELFPVRPAILRARWLKERAEIRAAHRSNSPYVGKSDTNFVGGSKSRT